MRLCEKNYMEWTRGLDSSAKKSLIGEQTYRPTRDQRALFPEERNFRALSTKAWICFLPNLMQSLEPHKLGCIIIKLDFWIRYLRCLVTWNKELRSNKRRRNVYWWSRNTAMISRTIAAESVSQTLGSLILSFHFFWSRKHSCTDMIPPLDGW